MSDRSELRRPGFFPGTGFNNTATGERSLAGSIASPLDLEIDPTRPAEIPEHSETGIVWVVSHTDGGLAAPFL